MWCKDALYTHVSGLFVMGRAVPLVAGEHHVALLDARERLVVENLSMRMRKVALNRGAADGLLVVEVAQEPLGVADFHGWRCPRRSGKWPGASGSWHPRGRSCWHGRPRCPLSWPKSLTRGSVHPRVRVVCECEFFSFKQYLLLPLGTLLLTVTDSTRVNVMLKHNSRLEGIFANHKIMAICGV